MSQKNIITRIITDGIEAVDKLETIQQCLSFLGHKEFYKVGYFENKVIIWKYEKHDLIYTDNRSGNEASGEVYVIINRIL